MHKMGSHPWLHFLGAGALLIAVAATAIGWGHARSPRNGNGTYIGTQIGHLAARVPPPPGGAGVAAADRQAFATTRALQGTWRWHQAARDANQSPRALLGTFSCAAGVELTAGRAPHLAALLNTAGEDSSHVASRAKSTFMRARPYTLYAGPTCPRPDGLGAKHDYPSGHAARGWTWALILAELLPDRRAPLMSRAKAYGESRVVCGFHTPTGVEAGRRVAMLTVPALMADPAFKDDLRKASTELAALRQGGQAPPERQCRSETALSQTPY